MSARIPIADLAAPAHRASVIARAARIRRRSGDYPPRARLPRITFAEAVAIVTRDAALRVTRDQLKTALPAVSAVMRFVRAVSAGPALTYDERAMHRSRKWRAAHPAYHRAYRLKARAPSGVAREVWHEIVDACNACCIVCRSPATRVMRLEDGTPAPACIRHETCKVGDHA